MLHRNKTGPNFYFWANSLITPALFNELPKPMLGYCRTGRRTATVWALSQAGKKSVPEIFLKSASRAGLDFSDLVPRITRKS